MWTQSTSRKLLCKTGVQSGTLWLLRGGTVGKGETQEGGDSYIIRLDSHWCTTEITTAAQSNCSPIFLKKVKLQKKELYPNSKGEQNELSSHRLSYPSHRLRLSPIADCLKMSFPKSNISPKQIWIIARGRQHYPKHQVITTIFIPNVWNSIKVKQELIEIQ